MGVKVVVNQLVPAAPPRVFASWSSGEAMALWWWPHIPDTTYRVDARDGGTYRIESESFGIGAEGDFISVSPPTELVMTWRWLTRGVWQVEEPLTVRFLAVEDGTLVSVTHELDDLAGEGEDIRTGWEHVLARLAAHHGP